MTDATPANAPKAKLKAAASEAQKFPTPSFDMPKFDVPSFEVPPAFRELAEKGVSQAKEQYEKMRSVAEEATGVMEDTYAKASKGAAEYSQKMIDNARANSNAAFDLFGALLSAKSYAEVVELSTGFARKQFETLTEQAKELTAVAQKAGTETFEPIKDSVTSVLKKAA
jgi:phasin